MTLCCKLYTLTAIRPSFEAFCVNSLFQSVAVYIFARCVSRRCTATPYLYSEQRDPSVLPQQLLRQMAQQFTHTRYSNFVRYPGLQGTTDSLRNISAHHEDMY
jgi:hypothetical protein